MTTLWRARWNLGLLIILALVSIDHRPVVAQDEKTWLINQINNLRATVGVHAYVWNSQLAAAAQQQSEYMAATGHVSHVQSNGSTPANRAAANGYGGSWIIENIYGGGIATASDAWNFWINSSVHYSGLVNANTNEIGIGVASGPNGNYYTLVFGKGNINPPAAQPVDNPAPAAQSAAPPPQAPVVNNNNNVPVAPTRRVLPTRTFTPSATIPTFTPSFTWTFTPLWTPSITPTPPPATVTAISLPTLVAQAPPIFTNVLPTLLPSAILSLEASPEPVTLTSKTNDENILSRLLPILIVGQIAFIGLGLGSLFILRKR